MYLLSSDLHLTDRPEDEYRWSALNEIQQLARNRTFRSIHLLGDVWDRRDRHSAALVNRSVAALRGIAHFAPLVILRGNHDTTLRVPAFWEFLNQLDAPVRYVSEPVLHNDVGGGPGMALLPYTPQPKTDWASIPFRALGAAFMHATAPGAATENGTVMDNPEFPVLPRRCRYYSGDIHVPQQCGAITYVGAPHPIKFGDGYPCRMLVLDGRFEIEQEIVRHPVRKLLLDIRGPAGLSEVRVKPGDQVRIRLNGSAADLDRWGTVETAIAAWAADHNVRVAGTEIIISGTHNPAHNSAPDPANDPQSVLRAFAASERLSEAMLDAGLDLLRDAE